MNKGLLACGASMIATGVNDMSQGRIQNFLIGGSNLQRGFDLLIVPDYLLFFSEFSGNSQ